MSFDAVNMYPSIKFDLIVKAVTHFAKKAGCHECEHESELLDTCLQLLQFSMETNILTFRGKYYEYGGKTTIKGLNIGGFESARLADLVAAYLLDITDDLFDESLYNKIYRDDGNMVWRNTKRIKEIAEWLEKFQKRINDAAGNDYLQFTVTIWACSLGDLNYNEELKLLKCKNISVDENNFFPFLDMEMYWTQEKELNFRVHIKPNQTITYLNSQSNHPGFVLKAIPSGVIQRLTKLTSVNEMNKNKKG
jgi:hypothetical protein